MSQHSIYFASTILHLYAAASIALERKDEIAHLIFIDQPEDKDYPLFSIVNDWSSSPFASVKLLPGRFKGLVNKLKQRKKIFRQLEEIVNNIKPAHIFTGNDRRIEFQYSMHIAETLKLQTTGHYMDEGTFTYVGRKASSHFSDAIIDNIIKKISYGFWWRNPKTVGESFWIKDIHVAFPSLIDEQLKKKSIFQLDHEMFVSPKILKLSESILEFYHVDTNSLSTLDALFTLPHESLFSQNPEYRHTLLKKINQMKADGLMVAAKYHPRNSDPDVLNLSDAGVNLLPSGVSFEAILPLLPSTSQIIGDLSSTLLISRWLRPELKVTSICSGQGDADFIKLFKALEIEVKYV